MTLAQIEQEFHGADESLPAHKVAEHRNTKIRTTFENVCRRFKLDVDRLKITPPAELAGMVKAVDATLRVDEVVVSAALKVYLAMK